MKAILAPLTALFVTLAVTQSVAAQTATSTTSDTSVTTTRDGGAPRRENTVAGVRTNAQSSAVEEGRVATSVQAPSGRSKAYMIVGGAAFIGGLLIGDDAGTAIAVVGLGLGIYGLYLYVQ